MTNKINDKTTTKKLNFEKASIIVSNNFPTVRHIRFQDMRLLLLIGKIEKQREKYL